MDIIRFNSSDLILMVVDCFMKMVHLIPCNKSITGENKVKLFFNHVFRYHGLLKNIIFLYHGPNLHPCSRSGSSRY
jgi:hypothetical protein